MLLGEVRHGVGNCTASDLMSGAGFVWGVATWNAGFLSQRCLGCVGDLGVQVLDWDVCGWT